MAADMVKEKVNEHITKILRDKERIKEKESRKPK